MSDWKLLNTSTASGASSVEFTDLTGYKIFKFVFVDVNPATDNVTFAFQGSIDGGSNYNVTMTTTNFRAGHRENDTWTGLDYKTDQDQAQGTSYQNLIYSISNDADASTAGELHLFNPTSTTYVKHFYARASGLYTSPGNLDSYTAGYFNTTSAINGISFKFLSGNLDAVIKQYGLVAT